MSYESWIARGGNEAAEFEKDDRRRQRAANRLMLEAPKQITCEDCGEPTTEWDWAGKYQVCPKCLAKETDAAADRSDWLYHQRRD